MSAATLALSPGRRIGRVAAMHLAMAVSIGMISLPAAGSSLGATSLAPAPVPTTSAGVTKAYGKLPVRFEANQGQSDGAVKFLVRTGGATVFLTSQAAVWALPATAGATGDVVRMSLVGANPAPEVRGTDALPGITNYFTGNDPAKWHTNVPSYSGVRYQSVYPGIDQVYHAGGGGMEYDFVVAPGADPAAIRMAITGGRAAIDGGGDLVVTTGTGEVRQHAPSLYQTVGGTHRAVDGHFAARPDGSIGFAVGAYDHARPLVIDPLLSYSTYLGGSGFDQVNGIAIDSAGDAYVTGKTGSPNFPVAGAYQSSCTKCSISSQKNDAFITKLNPTGSALVYSTYLGGTTGDDEGRGGIAVDSAGNAFVAGYSESTDFPTPNGYKTACGCPAAGGYPGDAFLAELGPTGGTLLYGTYIGGSDYDSAAGVALGSSGVVYVTGGTQSTDFVTANPNPAGVTPYQAISGGGRDMFLVKVNTGLSGSGSLLYSTYLGGAGGDSATAVGVDPATPDVAYIAGSTSSANFPTTSGAFQTGLGGASNRGTLTKLDTTKGTSGLLYSTYVGGTTNQSYFQGLAVKGGVAYMTGQTSSTTYPTASPYQSANNAAAGNGTVAVISDIDTTKSGAAALLYSTYLGGALPPGYTTNQAATAFAIAVDSGGKLTVTGNAQAGFPLLHNFQGFPDGGRTAAFVAQLDPTAGTGGLVYSTAMGGGRGGNDTGYGVAVDSANPSDAFVGGATIDPAFPTTSGAFQTSIGSTNAGDGFVTKLIPGNPPPIVSGLSVKGGPFTGGTTVTITGSGFNTTGSNPATAVNFGAVPAASFHVDSDTQITAVSPCVAPSNGTCPDSALGTVPADNVNVSVTANGAASTGNSATHFLFGEGNSAPAAPCPACTGAGGDAAVPLADGRILDTQTGADRYTDGGTVMGLNVFTSGTALNHQRTFTAADVGKRLSASGFAVGSGGPIFAPGTVISSVTNSNTVMLSANANQTASAASFSVSNNATALYSPATNTWAPTGACNACGMADYVDGALTLTLLPSGKVLAAGGMDPTAQDESVAGIAAVPDAYLYDPGAGTWSPTKNTTTGSVTTLTSPRKGATATLLSTGKVLVAGGSNTGAPPALNVDAYNTAEFYDPGAGTFTATGSMTTARANGTASVLPSGNVLVAGGFITGQVSNGNAPATASAEQYNPTTKIWSGAGTMKTARAWNTMTTLPSSGACGVNCGKVLVANGVSCYDNCPPPAPAQDATVSAELYDPSTNSWAYTGAPSVARIRAEAALTAAGRVLVGNGGFNTAAERYDPATETWRSAGPSVGGDGCCALVMPAGPASVCGTNCGKVFFTGSGAGFYTPRPVLSALSPSSGAGMGGTTVTVTGTGLASVNQVHFGSDLSATAAAVPDPTTPDTKLTAVTPGELGTGTAGSTVDTTVTSFGGVSSTSAADRYGYGTFGALQVTTSPSLPSQISVDGIPRDTTALANLKMDAAPGSHTVCFREVPGYLPVACQNVTVTAGATTTATGTFVQKGTLAVTTNQTGGSVQVGPASHPAGSNVTNRDDGGINTDLAVGSYDICFGPVLNQKPPACQTVTVNAGATANITGTYTSKIGALGDDPTLGSLKVSTSPASLGTQIRVDGVDRNTNAIKNLKIAAGSHTVCVREVTGYLLPACQTVSVTATQNTSVTVTFVAKGTLTVTETPSGTAGTIFVDGTPRDDGGMSTDLPVGTSQVCFGAVSGYATPACRSVTITGGATVSTTGAY